MSRLTWTDLLIEDISRDQFLAWIAPWTGLVRGTVAPAFVSKFGVWLLRHPAGTVEMLDVFTGHLTHVADTFEEFMHLVNEPWWQEAFLLSELVAQLH